MRSEFFVWAARDLDSAFFCSVAMLSSAATSLKSSL